MKSYGGGLIASLCKGRAFYARSRSVRWRTDGARAGPQHAMLVNPATLRFLLVMLLLAALIVIAGWPSHSYPQAARSAQSGRALTESAAVDLRPGMTPDEVRELLGKPWRTALSGTSGGTLRWTYTWTGSPSSGLSERERILNVDFSAKSAEQWSLSAWNWSAY